jgi:MOSC domain-containing protein YiiM
MDMDDLLAPQLTEAQLAETLPLVRQSPATGGTVVQIVVRPDRDLRLLPDHCQLTPEDGIPGDRWARHCTRRLPDGQLNPDTQLTLMNTRFLATLAGTKDRWPVAGDNLVVDLDLSEVNLPAGQRLRLGEAVIEVSAEPHTGCSKFAKRFGAAALKFVNSPEGRRLRLRGVNARVVQAGTVRLGDPIVRL